QTKVTGVVLAGGQARRMANRDKGLVLFRGYPMIGYMINAMEPLVDDIIVSANRNRKTYEQFGWPVIADQHTTFDGPLAGILAAMRHTDADILLVSPCDSPLIKTYHLSKLLATRAEHDADIAVAFDGERLHPVFLALKTVLCCKLHDYLGSGNRKLEQWLMQHNTVMVDFSDSPGVFANINTLSDLSDLELLAPEERHE
ncbi:MAG: molybdenum cofactor guanylyltransferase MobA, partial [Gammaproteobacteria bacterium]